MNPNILGVIGPGFLNQVLHLWSRDLGQNVAKPMANS